jgi:hypothetical protein
VTALDSSSVFAARTAVNYENQFFMPEHQGQYFTIDSWLFEDDEAHMLSEQPFELIVID